MAGSGEAHLRGGQESLLTARRVVVTYAGQRNATVQAVSDVSLDIKPGETLGLVGESGCGKSSLARAIMQLPRPTSGDVTLEGESLPRLSGRGLRLTRRRMQMIFQDPISSLNPMKKVRDIVAEGLVVGGPLSRAEVSARVTEVLELVGLDPDTAGSRRPHEFSGGQCQRISIARAVVTEPSLIICDEPVSALDVSVQAQIINLLADMKQRYQLSLLFIAHDLAVVKNVSDRVGVMYLGKLCEIGHPDEIFKRPAHPYTVGLLASVPEPDPNAQPGVGGLTGDLPSPMNPPSGCRFRTRCPQARERCATEEPVVRAVGPDQFVACHYPVNLPDEVGPALQSASLEGGRQADQATNPTGESHPGGPQ